MYRILEGILEKRRSGRDKGVSVVMDYLKDDDSEPYRYELNLCREIRNILSHNADDAGAPVVEPSEAILASLREILEYVSRPRYAIEYGTSREKILCAHPNERIIDVMHCMSKNGYSHVPVEENGHMLGVFSVGSLFAHLEKRGLEALSEDARIASLKAELQLEKHGAEKYLFLPRDTTIVQVSEAFERRGERNSRLSAVFITENGSQDETLLAMLTPWDVLRNL